MPQTPNSATTLSARTHRPRRRRERAGTHAHEARTSMCSGSTSKLDEPSCLRVKAERTSSTQCEPNDSHRHKRQHQRACLPEHLGQDAHQATVRTSRADLPEETRQTAYQAHNAIWQQRGVSNIFLTRSEQDTNQDNARTRSRTSKASTKEHAIFQTSASLEDPSSEDESSCLASLAQSPLTPRKALTKTHLPMSISLPNWRKLSRRSLGQRPWMRSHLWRMQMAPLHACNPGQHW